jgi:hypothetical protein
MISRKNGKEFQLHMYTTGREEAKAMRKTPGVVVGCAREEGREVWGSGVGERVCESLGKAVVGWGSGGVMGSQDNR